MEKQIKQFLTGKVVLVAGGTGSIGSELVRRILQYPVKQIRILSRDEFKQFHLQNEFQHLPAGKVRFLIGDIRDRDRVFLAMEDVDIVFNAAAMKHVHLSEDNPFEAVKTNVIGTQNMIEAARAADVKHFVQISTDKAAMPANVMGATKLLSEKMVVLAEHYRGAHDIVFSAVRFGNVFGSRGSVVPLFLEQIKKGGPVTLTHKEMNRFVMSISDAVTLVLKACVLAKGGELFILKMPVINIYDLARGMIEILAPRYGHDPKIIEIKEIGRRAGEKLCEALMREEEAAEAAENEEMFCLGENKPKGFVKCKLGSYQSDRSRCLNYSEVVTLLHRYFKEPTYFPGTSPKRSISLRAVEKHKTHSDLL